MANENMVTLQQAFGHNRPPRTKDEEDALFEMERNAHLPVACQRVSVRKAMVMVPRWNWTRWLDRLAAAAFHYAQDENGELITGEDGQFVKVRQPCCEHPENHDVEVWYNNDEGRASGIPSIYVFFCDGCNRRHRIIMPQSPDPRPFWSVN